MISPTILVLSVFLVLSIIAFIIYFKNGSSSGDDYNDLYYDNDYDSGPGFFSRLFSSSNEINSNEQQDDDYGDDDE